MSRRDVICRRVIVEGGGVQALTTVPAGSTVLPVTDASAWFNPGGGQVASGNQRITYAGVDVGDGGSLVGPGIGPAAAPGLTAQDGAAGVESGAHGYAVTFVTASGESLPSPIATVTTGVLAAPSSAPTVGQFHGAGLDVGTHDYEVTFGTSAGETTPSPVSNAIVIAASYTVSAPGSAPTLANDTGGAAANGWNIGDSLYVVFSYITSFGETTPSANSGTVTAQILASGPFAHGIDVTVVGSSDPNVTGIRIYINVNGAWRGFSTVSNANSTTFWADAQYAGSPSGSNTALVQNQRVGLSSLAIGPSNVTSRKLYRRFNGAGTFKLVTTIANNTSTSYTDSTANASLGADAPSSNSAAMNHVALTGIPLGSTAPVPVLSRKVYRTAAGGSTLKQLTTIADNLTTDYTDTTGDGSLGANAPTSDTSGLQQPNGQVVPGSTAIVVAGTGAFSAAGGWAVIGNGQQVIRYTGISGGALTGIPSSGVGAIVAAIAYNSTITAAPALTGIPETGAGSIQYDINKGDAVNLLVIVDDTAAQAVIAAYLGIGDGVIEDYQRVDGITETEATQRATAELALRSSPEGRLSYRSRDPKTASGKTVSVNLTNPNPIAITGDFLIQQVRISQFRAGELYPTYEAQCSTLRFTLEDLLRLARKSAATS